MTKKLSIYLVFLAILAVGIFVGMHALLAHRAVPVVWKTLKVKDPPSLPVLNTGKMISEPLSLANKAIVPSPQGNSFAVLSKPTELTVVDVQSGRVVSQTVTSHPIQNVTWISERLLFMTTNHTLFTFDIQSRKVRLIQSFAPVGRPLQTIAFSPYTNDVFVVFSNQSGNTVYQFDTNEHDYIRNIGQLSIRHASYGSTNLTLYIEDTNHTLYQLKNGVLTRLRQHAAILKGAGNDLYAANLNRENQVISVGKYDGNGIWHQLCKLATPVSIGNVVVDHSGKIFAAFPHELVDESDNHRWGVPSGFEMNVLANEIVLTKGDQYKVVVN
jgi:hypothetical protein